MTLDALDELNFSTELLTGTRSARLEADTFVTFPPGLPSNDGKENLCSTFFPVWFHRWRLAVVVVVVVVVVVAGNTLLGDLPGDIVLALDNFLSSFWERFFCLAWTRVQEGLLL